MTVADFLQHLQSSGIVDNNQLKTLLDELPEGTNPNDAEPVAKFLIEKEVISLWQAKKLLQGKNKGFFLGKYKLISLLGRGGMSSVYLAEHVVMKRRCAIKVLPSSRIDDSSYLARFHLEAQAVAALDHPNIVRAYDVDQFQERDTTIHFLVMEHVSGTNLHELIVRRGPLQPADAAEFIRQAAQGLHHAHEAGLVHRDIKPGNLLLNQNQVVKLLDLGLARFFDEGDDQSLTIQHDEKVLGTADFLAPEQALNSHSVDRRADIYSLGCTLYFLLTKHAPFEQGTLAQRLMAHQTQQPKPVSDYRDDVPESLLEIMNRMMAKKPEERQQTSEQVAKEIEQWILTSAPKDWLSQHPGVEDNSLLSDPSVMHGSGSKIISGNQMTESDLPLENEEFTSFLSNLNQSPPEGSSKIKNKKKSSVIQANQDKQPASKIKKPPASETSKKASAKPQKATDQQQTDESSSSSSMLMYGGIGGAVLLLALVGYVLFGPNSSDSPEGPGSTAQTDPNEPETPPEKVRPEVNGTTITVGPEANFGTLNEALEYLRTNVSPTDNKEYTVTFQGVEKLSEPILINNESLLSKLPSKLTIRGSQEGYLPVSVSGSDPCLTIDYVSGVKLERFLFNGNSNQKSTLTIKGDCLGSKVLNCKFHNIAKIGILISDVAGLAENRNEIRDCVFRSKASYAVGIDMTGKNLPVSGWKVLKNLFVNCKRTGVLLNSDSLRWITIQQCRFSGGKSGIEWAIPAPIIDDLAICNNTFHQLEKPLQLTGMPDSSSSNLLIARNYFSNVSGNELQSNTNFTASEFKKVLSSFEGGISYNWTTRSKPEKFENAYDLCSPKGRYKDEKIQFMSTNPDSSDFLRPAKGTMWIKDISTKYPRHIGALPNPPSE